MVRQVLGSGPPEPARRIDGQVLRRLAKTQLHEQILRSPQHQTDGKKGAKARKPDPAFDPIKNEQGPNAGNAACR